jgi:hypothetical protein
MMFNMYNKLLVLLKDRGVVIEKHTFGNNNGHKTNITILSKLNNNNYIISIVCEYNCYNPRLPTIVVYGCDDPYEPGLYEHNNWKRNNIDDIIGALNIICL